MSETAAELGMTKAGLRRRIVRGDMAAQRVGNVYVIERTEVDRWRELGKQRPGPKPKAPKAPQPS